MVIPAGWLTRQEGPGLGCQGGLVKAAAEYLRRGDGLLGQAGDLRERVLARRRPGNEIEVLAVESGQFSHLSGPTASAAQIEQ